MADEDVTFVEAALQVVETFASRFTRRAVLFTSVIRKRSTFGQDGEQRINVRPLHDRINVHRVWQLLSESRRLNPSHRLPAISEHEFNEVLKGNTRWVLPR